MGICYAIAHDETHEAYDLGKGGWADWYAGLPTTAEETRASIFQITAHWQVDDACRERLAAEVWAFLTTHPGCRIINDCGNDWWREEPEPGDYRQVGSREE
jgi:hypothetical protein